MSAAVLVAFGENRREKLPCYRDRVWKPPKQSGRGGMRARGKKRTRILLADPRRLQFPHRIDFHSINVAGDRKNKFFSLPSPSPVRVFKSGKWSCHHNWKRKRSAAVDKKATKVNGAVTSKNCPFRANREGFLIECQSAIACGKGGE